MTHTSYVDPDHYEEADSALRGAIALSCIISDVSAGGENAGYWAPHVIQDLEEARRILLNSARSSVEDMRKDAWQAHALLGEYGPDAKARAEDASRVRKEAHA